jgi:alkylated DNA repair dioxygenase AlkB
MQGLTLVPEVIGWETESKLIQQIDDHKWDTQLTRRVQQFGYKYDYRAKHVVDTPLGPLPKWALDVCKLFQEKKLIDTLPNQLIVNEYREGQGIGKHTDHKRFGGVIFSLSLGAPCTMIFRRQEEVEQLAVKPRTFLKMEGEARHEWTHEIPPLEGKQTRRISLTFRYV